MFLLKFFLKLHHKQLYQTLFLKHSIKPVLGVIPKNQDEDLLTYPANNKFWDRVRNWKSLGWEIVMHGYTHVYDSTSYTKKDFLP